MIAERRVHRRWPSAGSVILQAGCMCYFRRVARLAFLRARQREQRGPNPRAGDRGDDNPLAVARGFADFNHRRPPPLPPLNALHLMCFLA